MKDKSAAKQTKPDFPDIDGDGNTKESMKQAAADKKSGAKMKKASPNKKNVPTEREANMAEIKKLNKEGSELNPRDPIMRSIRNEKFDKADELSMERTRRSREGNPMQMKMKKESMAKQTKKQKEKLPTGLVKEIAKKAGKAGTEVAREGIKAAGSKVAGKKAMTKKLETKKF
jgi:hypothetical protein